MDYEMKIMDARISGREDGEKVGEKRGKELANRAGVKNLIDVLKDDDYTSEDIFSRIKRVYGQYFSDDELKQFIAEAKKDSLQEA